MTDQSEITILIPTQNRPEALSLTLDHYALQTVGPETFDLLIIDDGSDNFDAVRRAAEKPRNLRVRLVSRPRGGPAAARNHALDMPTAPLILISGDDIIPGKTFLETHLRFHSEHPEKIYAALGFTTWHEGLKINDFMAWLDKRSGAQFDYAGIREGEDLTYRHFFTSNISLKREMVGAERFDTDFKHAAWEDLEFGYRLIKRGLKLRYIPAAIGYHYHHYEAKQFYRRCRIVGWYESLFYDKHPEVKHRGLARNFISVVWALCKFCAGAVPVYQIRILFSWWLGMADFALGRRI